MLARLALSICNGLYKGKLTARNALQPDEVKDIKYGSHRRLGFVWTLKFYSICKKKSNSGL